MDLDKLDPSATEFTKEELDGFSQILSKAKLIEEDKTLHRLVMRHIDKTVKDFKSIDDLKQHSKNLAKDDEKKTDDEQDD